MSYRRWISLCSLIFVLAACQSAETTIPPELPTEDIASPTEVPTEKPAPPTEAPTEEIVPTPPPEPLTCEEVEGNCFVLRFDGENCSYQGPEIQETGLMTLLYINNGDGITSVNLVLHTGDETIQDMLDYLGEEPSQNHAPPWVNSLGPWELVGPGKRHTSVHDLRAGIHTMVCADTRYGWWYGGGFTAVE